eukprot:s297_g2.t1
MSDAVMSEHRRTMQLIQASFQFYGRRLSLCRSTPLAVLVESFCGNLSLSAFCLLEKALESATSVPGENKGDLMAEFRRLVQVGSLAAGTEVQTSDLDILAQWSCAEDPGEVRKGLDLLRLASLKLRKVCQELALEKTNFKLLPGSHELLAGSDRVALCVGGLDVDLLPGLEHGAVFQSMIFRSPTSLENYSGNVVRASWLHGFPAEVRGVVRGFKHLNTSLAHMAHASAPSGTDFQEFKKKSWLSSYGMSLIVVAVYLMCKDYMREAFVTLDLFRAVCKCFASLGGQDSLRLWWRSSQGSSIVAMPDDVARWMRQSRGSEEFPRVFLHNGHIDLLGREPVEERIPVLVCYESESPRLDVYDPFQDVQASVHSDALVLGHLKSKCQLILDSLARSASLDDVFAI